MNISIEISWWIIPALVTLVAHAWACLASSDGDGGSTYAAIGTALITLLRLGAALIISLAAWLVWAVLT